MKNQTALVTGAGSGIGQAIAKALAGRLSILSVRFRVLSGAYCTCLKKAFKPSSIVFRAVHGPLTKKLLTSREFNGFYI
jgi:hypothetical protein